jgi:hypothetical protein
VTADQAREVTRIHEHECPYVLWTASRGWISASDCHMGQPVPMDPPTGKRGAVA